MALERYFRDIEQNTNPSTAEITHWQRSIYSDLLNGQDTVRNLSHTGIHKRVQELNGFCVPFNLYVMLYDKGKEIKSTFPINPIERIPTFFLVYYDDRNLYGYNIRSLIPS